MPIDSICEVMDLLAPSPSAISADHRGHTDNNAEHRRNSGTRFAKRLSKAVREISSNFHAARACHRRKNNIRRLIRFLAPCYYLVLKYLLPLYASIAVTTLVVSRARPRSNHFLIDRGVCSRSLTISPSRIVTNAGLCKRRQHHVRV